MAKRDLERSLLRSARQLNNLNDLTDPADPADGVGELYDVDDEQRIRRRERRVESHAQGRLTEAARERLARSESEEPGAEDATADTDERPSSWGDADARGPEPWPAWVVTGDAAFDRDFGVLKTGKEADVFLLERWHPETGQSALLAAKRYRTAAHRLFHRDSGYLEGRRARASREQRAIESRTKFGRNLIAEKWSVAEFDALATLWSSGVPVPYPVQRIGSELLLEFVGQSDGTAAPRLAEARADRDELAELWSQLVDVLFLLAGLGYTHGDLSAYNLLVHEGELIFIDLPQLVDVVTNPRGPEYLARDVANIAQWFYSQGLRGECAEPERLRDELLGNAGLG